MTTALANLVYIILWAVGIVFFYLPFFVKDFVANVVARFWFYVLRFRRRVIIHNLCIGLPRASQEPMQDYELRIVKFAIANMRHYVLCLFEVFERFHWDEKVFARKVRVQGGAAFRAFQRRQFQDRKQGYFFLTAHLGNWELITAAGVMMQIPLTIITKALRNSFFDTLWVRSRKRFGLELLEEKGSGLSAIRAIRACKAVGFILDQHTGLPHGLDAQFLGHKAWCPKGLAILSWRLKVPVLPSYILRQTDGTHVLNFDPELDFSALNQAQFLDEKGALNEAGMRAHIEICNRNMEKWIALAPDQYNWMHKRFKESFDYSSKLLWEL